MPQRDKHSEGHFFLAVFSDDRGPRCRHLRYLPEPTVRRQAGTLADDVHLRDESLDQIFFQLRCRTTAPGFVKPVRQAEDFRHYGVRPRLSTDLRLILPKPKPEV